MIELAKQLAIHAHEGQMYGNHPYTYHLQNAVTAFNEVVKNKEDSCGDIVYATIWLHDVVEDTHITLDTIRNIFGNVVYLGVDAITKRSGENRDEYISRVKRNKLATLVKAADTYANYDKCVSDGDHKRADYYYKQHADLMSYINDTWRD